MLLKATRYVFSVQCSVFNNSVPFYTILSYYHIKYIVWRLSFAHFAHLLQINQFSEFAIIIFSLFIFCFPSHTYTLHIRSALEPSTKVVYVQLELGSRMATNLLTLKCIQSKIQELMKAALLHLISGSKLFSIVSILHCYSIIIFSNCIGSTVLYLKQWKFWIKNVYA